MNPMTEASGRALDDTTGTARPAGQAARPPDSAERITVALIPRVAGGLRRLQERTNLSKTDIANRAISSYEFFDQHMQAGRELILRDSRTGETLLVRFL
jgi:hypothetical protein